MEGAPTIFARRSHNDRDRDAWVAIPHIVRTDRSYGDNPSSFAKLANIAHQVCHRCDEQLLASPSSLSLVPMTGFTAFDRFLSPHSHLDSRISSIAAVSQSIRPPQTGEGLSPVADGHVRHLHDGMPQLFGRSTWSNFTMRTDPSVADGNEGLHAMNTRSHAGLVKRRFHNVVNIRRIVVVVGTQQILRLHTVLYLAMTLYRSQSSACPAAPTNVPDTYPRTWPTNMYVLLTHLVVSRDESPCQPAKRGTSYECLPDSDIGTDVRESRL